MKFIYRINKEIFKKFESEVFLKDKEKDLRLFMHSFYLKSSEINDNEELKNLSLLLGNIASLLLHSTQLQESFSPMVEMSDGSRSFLPEDLNEYQIMLLSQNLSLIHDYRLKARVADVLWLKKRSFKKYALTAIKSYLRHPLFQSKVENTFISFEAWSRAITLCKVIGEKEILVKIQDDLIDYLFNKKYKEKKVLRITELLFRLNTDKETSLKIANLLFLIAEKLGKDDFFYSNHLYEEAIKWYRRIKLDEKMYVSFEKRAELLVVQSKTSENGASCLLQEAITIYRKIPQKNRTTKINEELDRLELLLLESAKYDIDSCDSFSVPFGKITMSI